MPDAPAGDKPPRIASADKSLLRLTTTVDDDIDALADELIDELRRRGVLR